MWCFYTLFLFVIFLKSPYSYDLLCWQSKIFVSGRRFHPAMKEKNCEKWCFICTIFHSSFCMFYQLRSIEFFVQKKIFIKISLGCSIQELLWCNSLIFFKGPIEMRTVKKYEHSAIGIPVAKKNFEMAIFRWLAYSVMLICTSLLKCRRNALSERKKCFATSDVLYGP